MNRLLCIETKKINSPQLFAQVIYNNFLYLKDFPSLQHNKENIILNLQKELNLCYLVYNKHQLIGYLVGDFRILSDNRYVYYISYLFISQLYRNKKIGGRLLKNIINKCKLEGVNFIVLTCDTYDNKCMNFYKKYGFSKDPILGTNDRHNVLSLFL